MSSATVPIAQAPGPGDGRALDTAVSAEYLIRTSELPDSVFRKRYHHIATDRYRYQIRLGNMTGLTKTGVQLYRLPPGMTSMALHWHEHFEDWMYILDAGEGAVLLVWEPGQEKSKGDIVPREEAIKTGDFLGFPAGVERAHALKAGTKELVYLVGGNRGLFDVCHYPMEGKKTKTSIDETSGMFRGDTEDEDRFALRE